MRSTEATARTKPERKIISVSVKRQLTIPQKYFDALGFSDEAECILHKGGLLVRPIRNNESGEFSELILADLISQGYEGAVLLEKFKEYSKAVRPAVESIIQEAEEYVRSGNGEIARDELFGSEA